MMSNLKIKIWLNGKIINKEDAYIKVLSPTSQYGVNVFEGIRGYYNYKYNKIFLFRVDDHHKRLLNSIKLIRFEEKYSKEDLFNALIETIRVNNFREDISIRQTVFLDGNGNWSSYDPIGMFVYVSPKTNVIKGEGINCCICSWERINDNSLPPRVKVGGNYLNSRLAQIEAKNNGYDMGLFLNNKGKISEAPGSCIFMIKDNTLFTPSTSESILESITRDTIIKICKNELNINTVEKEIDRTELYLADEVFLCGSAVEILPIISIDKYQINKSKRGQITKKIIKLYKDIVSGNNEKYSSWLTEIKIGD